MTSNNIHNYSLQSDSSNVHVASILSNYNRSAVPNEHNSAQLTGQTSNFSLRSLGGARECPPTLLELRRRSRTGKPSSPEGGERGQPHDAHRRDDHAGHPAYDDHLPGQRGHEGRQIIVLARRLDK